MSTEVMRRVARSGGCEMARKVKKNLAQVKEFLKSQADCRVFVNGFSGKTITRHISQWRFKWRATSSGLDDVEGPGSLGGFLRAHTTSMSFFSVLRLPSLTASG